eukprot:6183817-Pleurochrysis_carterae.AAC.1
MAAERFAVGELVFVPDPDDAFVLRKVHSCGKGSGADARLEVTRVDGKGGVEAVRDALAVVEADPLSVDGAEDMVKFTNLTAAALLHNLRVRYARDQMYSCAGSILISVNPFKQLNIYTEKEMQRCKDADVKELQELPPHVYVIAEGAFRGMLVEQKMQAILISGVATLHRNADDTGEIASARVPSMSRECARTCGGADTVDLPDTFATCQIRLCALFAHGQIQALAHSQVVVDRVSRYSVLTARRLACAHTRANARMHARMRACTPARKTHACAHALRHANVQVHMYLRTHMHGMQAAHFHARLPTCLPISLSAFSRLGTCTPCQTELALALACSLFLGPGMRSERASTGKQTQRRTQHRVLAEHFHAVRTDQIENSRRAGWNGRRLTLCAALERAWSLARLVPKLHLNAFLARLVSSLVCSAALAYSTHPRSSSSTTSPRTSLFWCMRTSFPCVTLWPHARRIGSGED